MKNIFIVFLLLFYISSHADSQEIIGCYWGSWTSINQINIKLCTHAYSEFYVADSNGVITTTSAGIMSSFLGLKTQNPSVKLLASIGGYNAGTASFSAIAASPSLTSKFISNCLTLAQSYDGIDLDWEYPQASEKTVFVNLLALLKSALNAKGKILTIEAAAGSWQVSQSYDIQNVCKNVDLLNLMSYDLQWPYTTTGPNAGYSAVDASVATWINGGCPPNKIVLGLATYGYNFALTSSKTEVGAPASGATAIPYRSICAKLKSAGWTTAMHDKTPYLYKGNEWISYDDPVSLATKLNIVTTRILPGVFFWSTDQDDYDSSCGMGSFPLISAVYRAFNMLPGGETTSKIPATQTTVKTTTKIPLSTTQKALTKSSTKALTTTTQMLKCTTDGYFAYPGDCKKFYVCFSGSLHLFYCPSETGWSQATTSCLLKENVPGCL